MRIALFDATAGGHRVAYVRRFVETLSPVADVVVAAPDETLEAAGQLRCETVALGAARPELGGRLSLGRRRVLRSEVAALYRVAERADAAIHLFADHALPVLASAAPAPCPIGALVFYPRAHYPDLYATPLSRPEALVAHGKERAIARWRRRPDALGLWTLDEGAATRWAAQGGAPAWWLPEPPVQASARPVASARRGCVLYGAMLAYKGLDRLAAALELAPTREPTVVAGYVEPTYRATFEELVAAMRAAGVSVDVRDRPHDEAEGLELLAGARCAVLPYRKHMGMSRVVLEAAHVGTPVVVHRHGLLSHLVSTHELGLVVDADDAAALRRAIDELCEDDAAAARYAPALARFATRYTAAAFTAALRRPLGLELVAPATSTASL